MEIGRTSLVRIFAVLITAIFTCASFAFATPRVAKVELLGGATVSDTCYLAVFDNDKDGTGIWVRPGADSGLLTTELKDDGVPDTAANAGCTVGYAEMFGLPSGYGQLLLSVSADTDPDYAMGDFQNELNILEDTGPVNTNTDVFGADTGPVSDTNIELVRAIPVGTEVKFTVDMNGEIPHLVAVMADTTPTVTYDADGDTLYIQAETFSTETAAGATFNSLIGFMVFTDTSLGDTPLRVIAQTNHWIGDAFPLLPGWDGDAEVAGNGGTRGTFSARCGASFYGPAGDTRVINMFFPNDNIARIFGSSLTSQDMDAFVSGENAENETDFSITRGTYNNFGVLGTLAQFVYEFASGKDLSLGVDADEDNDGVPDDYEVADTDIDADGVLDSLQPELLALKDIITGSSIGIKTSSGVMAEVSPVDSDNLKEDPPASFLYGLFNCRITGLTNGEEVQVTYILPDVFLGDWYKYDDNDGWVNYTQRIVQYNGRNVTIRLKDGDYGDADGTANGVIVDPGGPAGAFGGGGGGTALGDDDDDDDGGSASLTGACFIAAACYGTPRADEVKILCKFRDRYLLTNTIGKMFVESYYRTSPPIADFISHHPLLKAAVRTFLKPIVWISKKTVDS